jgi:hypothetical protein
MAVLLKAYLLSNCSQRFPTRSTQVDGIALFLQGWADLVEVHLLIID